MPENVDANLQNFMSRIFSATATIVIVATVASCGGVFDRGQPTEAETLELRQEMEKLLEAQINWVDFSVSVDQHTVRISHTFVPACRAEYADHIPVMSMTKIDLNDVKTIIWTVNDHLISGEQEELAFQLSREVAKENFEMSVVRVFGTNRSLN